MLIDSLNKKIDLRHCFVCVSRFFPLEMSLIAKNSLTKNGEETTKRHYMASTRTFEAGEKVLRGGFFPTRFLRWHDKRRVTSSLLVNEDATVQENTFYNEMLKGQLYLTRGETRQTKAAPWSARRRPTHFVALRLPQQSTLYSSISALHADVKDSFSSSQWYPAFTPLPRLHLTLAVMTLDENNNNQQQQKQHQQNDDQASIAARICSEAFASWAKQTNDKGFLLRSNTLGFFDDGRVAFARIAQDYDMPLLQRCIKDLRAALSDAGIDVKGNKHDDFVPHVTVAKLTQRLSKEKFNGQRSLPRSLFTHMAWDDLGAATFSSAGLCSMMSVSDRRGENDGTTLDSSPPSSSLDAAAEAASFPSQEGSEAAAITAQTSRAGEGKAGAKTTGDGADVKYWDQVVSSSLAISRRK